MPTILESTDRLLFIKPTSLGDVVQSLAAVCAIKKARPTLTLDFLVADIYTGLLEGHPHIDEVLTFPRKRMKGGLAEFTRAFGDLRRQLRSRKYDTALDLQGLARSALCARMSRAPHRIGFADAREMAPLFYTDKVDSPRKSVHAVRRYLHAVRYLGAEVSEQDVRFALEPSEEVKKGVKELLPDGPFCAFAPGARWETKKWPLGHFIELARFAREEHGLAVTVVGSPDEAELGKRISTELGDNTHNLAGKTTIPQLAAVLHGSKAVVSNDSGPMHMAAAMGVPTVSFFGPTSPDLIAPWGQEELVLWTEEPCRGCYRRKCHTMPAKCLSEISVKKASAALTAALEKRRPERI
ncbi:MAG: lipopolysaccharide heptosyltransferase II [Planctomycetota bacterium]|nr:lipopolysaccharide heptosyltransferase II [Planctomycetota bacterium]